MQTFTEELFLKLQNISDINSFFKMHEHQFLKETTENFLNSVLELKKMSVAEIAKTSGVGEYTYKIFRGERTPSRDVLIALAFGMGLSIEETQLLLRISKFAVLDAREKRDSVIIFSITNGLSVFQADDLLYENNLPTING